MPWLGPFHLLQIGWLLVTALWIGRCGWVLFVEAPIDLPTLRNGLEGTAPTAQASLLRAFLRTGARLTWCGKVLQAGTESESELEAVLFELDHRGATLTTGLRAVGRVATGLGLLGAVIQVLWLFQGSHGLLALQAGLVERVAAAAAMMCLALGLGTALLVRIAVRHFDQAQQRLRQCLRFSAVLVRQLPASLSETSRGTTADAAGREEKGPRIQPAQGS